MSVSALSKSGFEGIKAKSFTPIYNLGVFTCDFLIIAGGGGGGSGNYRDNSGGGGAGGYRNSFNSESSGGGGSAETALTLSLGTSYTVSVGGGGSGSASGTTSGNDSSISGPDISTITSLGGGRGGGVINTTTDANPETGGSGGGGAYVFDNGSSDSGAAGEPNQGYAGGNYNVDSGGAGGGAGANGENAGTDGGGHGGDGATGVASTISGSSVTRGGGGGGGGFVAGGTGGTGGGGAGGLNAGGSAGTANTGGGGGGQGSQYNSSNRSGGSGGSGVIYLRYPNTYTATVTTAVATTTTSGNDKITEITSGTGTIVFEQEIDMAHYAFLNSHNIVTEVITGIDEDNLDNLPEGFSSWEEFYGDFRGQTCKRTSYNTSANQHLLDGTPFRGNYAGKGYTYDEVNDVFIGPKPFNSWVLNDSTWCWEAPVAYPSDANADYSDTSLPVIHYDWNEQYQKWVEVSRLQYNSETENWELIE